ncbi:hypothetical protein ADL19_14925 [Streptomyces purpurogeneiscleroticus]|nr:hypothetical protein ADL19_14925 [Streptomyces purpurogeneiscleroticus]
MLEVLSDGTIRPRSKFDREKIAKKLDRAKPEANGAKLLRASLANIRSLPQLRLYWPWIRKVSENSPTNISEKLLHNMLLVACGYTEPFISIDGEMQLIPSSIAFDEMGDKDFTEYFEKAQQIVAEKILPGVSLKQLMNEARDECSFPEAA